jgi:SAM-dependent methyltransferase
LLRRVPRPALQRVAHIGSRMLKVFYLGSKVQCSVCERKFRKFLPFGRGPASRENALCPHCLSLERHRLIWYYLKNDTDFFTAPRKMLHVAPEYCFISRFKKMDNLDYTTGDLESPLADVMMDVHDIPFDDATFDVLFCNHVLEHVIDDVKVMQEIRRVLKPGGWAILQSPMDMNLETTYEDLSITDPRQREIHFGQDDHLRMYGRDYDKRLEKGGFEVELYDVWAKPEADNIARYMFMDKELLYIAKNGVSAAAEQV